MDTHKTAGAWVPLSALRQGPRGTWVLLTVTQTEGGTAMIAQGAVEIVHLLDDRAFIRGGFESGLRYLPDGTHRVVPGEAVHVAELV